MPEREILIVDDEERVRSSLSLALADGRTEVRTAETGERALAAVSDAPPDLVLTDVRMPGLDGLELLELLAERAPGVDVVLMTAYDDLATAAGAMRRGAADFLVKPLDLHQLRAVVDRVFRDRRARSGEEPMRSDGEPTVDGDRLVGHHPEMIEIFKRIGQLAGSRTTVLIRGESGTGKELIARAIHEHSSAAEEPFVAVNCTALPTALLESELFGHVEGAFTGASSDRRVRFALAGRSTIWNEGAEPVAPDAAAARRAGGGGRAARAARPVAYRPDGPLGRGAPHRPARADALGRGDGRRAPVDPLPVGPDRPGGAGGGPACARSAGEPPSP